MANTIPLEAIYISNLVRSLLPLLYSSRWRRCGGSTFSCVSFFANIKTRDVSDGPELKFGPQT